METPARNIPSPRFRNEEFLLWWALRSNHRFRATRDLRSGTLPGQMSAGIESTSPDLLRLEYCPRCGYALEGLPDEGVCPECGRAYDQQMIVLYGWARGSGAQVINSRSKKLLWFWIAILLVQLPVLLANLSRRSSITPLMMIVMFGAPVAVSLLLKRKPTELPPVQVRFNRAGCVQCDTPPDLSSRSRFHRAHVIFGPGILIAFAIAALATSQPEVFKGLLFGAAIVFTIVIVIRLARWKKPVPDDESIRALQDEARLGPWQTRMTPWSRIEKVDIQPVRSGSWRMKAIRSNSWYAGHAVDVEVDCTDEAARELSHRIEMFTRPTFPDPSSSA